MLALARIFVLVKRRSVKSPERVRVARKVRGHPIQNHPDAGLMALIDENNENRRVCRSATWAR